MKRWRVVQFSSPVEAERYLNGLSIEPDQIKGLFALPSRPEGGEGGVVLVCWLTAHQQRVEQLRQQPRSEDDHIPAPDGGIGPSAPPGEPPRGEPRAGRRRREESEE